MRAQSTFFIIRFVILGIFIFARDFLDKQSDIRTTYKPNKPMEAS